MESRSIDQCQREIGFCPQYNALFNLLTVREHLEMFRKLSGSAVDCTVQLIADIQLEDVADVVYILSTARMIHDDSFPLTP